MQRRANSEGAMGGPRNDRRGGGPESFFGALRLLILGPTLGKKFNMPLDN